MCCMLPCSTIPATARNEPTGPQPGTTAKSSLPRVRRTGSDVASMPGAPAAHRRQQMGRGTDRLVNPAIRLSGSTRTTVPCCRGGQSPTRTLCRTNTGKGSLQHTEQSSSPCCSRCSGNGTKIRSGSNRCSSQSAITPTPRSWERSSATLYSPRSGSNRSPSRTSSRRPQQLSQTSSSLRSVNMSGYRDLGVSADIRTGWPGRQVSGRRGRRPGRCRCWTLGQGSSLSRR
jgi:hypothetical protein